MPRRGSTNSSCLQTTETTEVWRKSEERKVLFMSEVTSCLPALTPRVMGLPL